MCAGIHTQGAANRPGNAAIEREAGDPRVGRRARDFHVRDDGARAQRVAILDFDLAEAAAEANDDARHAAVAHQQVRAKTDDEHRQVRRNTLQEIRKIGLVSRRKENLRRTAGTEPRDVSHRRAGCQATAQFRKVRFQLGRDVGKGHEVSFARRVNSFSRRRLV